MRTAVQQWGNSLAIRIPRQLAHESRMNRGSTVELSSSNGSLVVTPVGKRRRYSLASLIKKITPASRHAEVDWGKRIGREVW